jgi:hypothetical protein
MEDQEKQLPAEEVKSEQAQPETVCPTGYYWDAELKKCIADIGK